MTPPLRALALLLVAALVLAACTGGDPEPAEEAAQPAGATASPSAGAGGSAAPGGTGIALAPGAEVDAPEPVLQAAGDWIAEGSGLTDMLREEIFLDGVTRTRDVYHLRFVQQHGEVSVRGAQFVVHVRDTGEVLGASQSLVETLPGEGTTEELGAAEAAEIAEKAVPGTVEGEPETTATWLEVGEELRLGWEVQVATTDPPSSYAVVVDATDGSVLAVDRLATDHGWRARATGAARDVAAGEVDLAVQVAQGGGAACDLPAPPSACIFVVDPIYASGDPAVSPEAANRTLVGVPLRNLLDPSSPDLVGRYAQIAPQVASAYASADGTWGAAGRGSRDGSFEAGMTYYWIDYTQQVVQEMGFDFHGDDPVDFVPVEPAFPDNAFYLFTEDRIHMGIGVDGVNEAEDAQGIIHEYGHALLQAAVPDIISEEGGAVHEGFADLVSVLTTLEFRNGDVGCLFHWAERGECIRRIDTELTYPDDLSFAVHLDGMIYTGAVWEVFRRVLERDTGLTPEDCQDRSANPCDAVRDEVYATLLGSLPFLTPTLTLDDAAAAFAASDQTFFDGRNADIITDVFTTRGLAAGGTPAVQVEALGGSEPSDASLTVKISHSYRGDLALTVDVVDAGGQPLCSADLIAPDPADDQDNLQGRFQLEGTDCAELLPPGPDQVWLLTVVDTLEQDEGSLFQFGIEHEGQRFLAPGLPLAIPDADPTGVTAAIGGPAPTVAIPDGDPGDAAPAAGGGTTTIAYEISHSYAGDLLVQLLVGDPATGRLDCRIDLHQPDAGEATADLAAEVDVSDCGAFYPPAPDRAWLLGVADVAELDEGQVTAFRLAGPDGVVREAAVPVAIPDADPEGILVPLAG